MSRCFTSAMRFLSPSRRANRPCLWVCRIGAALLLFTLIGCRSSHAPRSGEEGSGPSAVQPSPTRTSPQGESETPAPLAAASVQPPAADEFAETGVQRPRAARAVFGLTNEIRGARGHAHLSRDSTLSRIACWHNQDMLVHGYAAHEDAEGRTPSDRTGREHRRLIGTTGENVFAASGASAQEETRSSENRAQTIVEEWMESPGHRANILRSKFTHLGACITQTRSQTRATQVFAAVWAYLDRPLPWSVSPHDSLSTAITPVKASAPPAEYAFVPVGEPLPRAFQKETRGRPFEGTIQFPSAPGRYGTRFLFPTEGAGRYTVLPGPRVLVD